jgi:hypothetical protein
VILPSFEHYSSLCAEPSLQHVQTVLVVCDWARIIKQQNRGLTLRTLKQGAGQRDRIRRSSVDISKRCDDFRPSGFGGRTPCFLNSCIAMEVLPIPLGEQLSCIAFRPDATPSIRMIAW